MLALNIGQNKKKLLQNMDKQFFRQLLLLVNTEDQYQRLITYVDARIQQIRQ
jgi:hypothetical protein